MRFFLTGICCLLSFSACGGEVPRFFCHFPSEFKEVSYFDKVVSLPNTKSGRVIKLGAGHGLDLKLYKTYDEKTHVISVYQRKNLNYKTYTLLKMDLSQETPLLFKGSGWHTTIQKFKKSFSVKQDFEKHFQDVNRNPELIKYLPKRPSNQEISVSFLKTKYECESISLLDYMMKNFLLTLMALTAG